MELKEYLDQVKFYNLCNLSIFCICFTFAYFADIGYFIGIDDENQRIVLCIRGTETIGDSICDLDAKAVRKSFGIKETGPFYYVHGGIFDAAKYLHEEINITAKIAAILKENEGYKIFVTGHS